MGVYRASNSEDLLEKAISAANSGNHAEAVHLYSRILERREIAEILNQRALSFGALKNHRLALQDLGRAIELSSNDPDLYVNRGNVLVREKRFNEAILDFSTALSLRPKCPVSLNSRAFSYSSSGQMQEAIRDYWSAIEIDNQYVSPVYNLAVLCKKLGRLDEAKALVDRAMRLKPGDPDIISLSKSLDSF